MARHCPECNFIVSRSANYCPKCGAFLAQSEPADYEQATASYVLDEKAEVPGSAEGDGADKAASGALVIRSGGGRAGESFLLHGEKMTIGRSPDTDVFLDDVTVSRDHAVLVRRGDGWHIDDSGSLNGTYVNRKRVESQLLEDDDELQVGKYKLTYFVH